MQKNTVWLALIVTLTMIVLWYSGKFIYHYYEYMQLSSRAPATEMQWSITAKNNENYLPKANYTFTANGKTYHGSAILEDRGYWNEFAAKQAIQEFTNKKWGIWYNSSDPNISALQKHFPLKDAVSAAIMWTIVFYFVWLGYYSARFRN